MALAHPRRVQRHHVRFQSESVQQLNGRVHHGARQHHQFHSDAPILEVPVDHVYVVVDSIRGEGRQTIHLECQHLPQIFLGRRRQIDQFAQREFRGRRRDTITRRRSRSAISGRSATFAASGSTPST